MRADRVAALALAGAALLLAPAGRAAAAAPRAVTAATTPAAAFDGSIDLLPDLNGDGVPEVEIGGIHGDVIRDGKSGRILIRLGAGATLLPAHVGPGRTPGVEVVASTFTGTSVQKVVSAYDVNGHRVWQHTLAPLQGPAGADMRASSSASATASLDGDGSSDLVVSETLTADDEDGRHRLLRITVIDAATGVVRRLVDQTEGGIGAVLVPLGGGHDGLLVVHRAPASAGGATTFGGVDGSVRELWTHPLATGTTVAGAAPLDGDGSDLEAAAQASFGLVLGGLGQGGSGAGPDVLVSTGISTGISTGMSETTAGSFGSLPGAQAQLIDVRTGAVRWHRAAHLAGVIPAGGGRGPAGVVEVQHGRTVTISAVERSGATRWSHPLQETSGTPALVIAVGLGDLGGSPGPDIAISSVQLSGGRSTSLELDGGTGRALHPKGLDAVTGTQPAPGVVAAGAVAPGGTLTTLRATTGVGGLTTVTRRDLGKTRDRWSATVGGPGSIALNVDGASGPRGCGSALVTLGGADGASSLAVLGLTGGAVRWTIDLITGRVTRGAESATAC